MRSLTRHPIYALSASSFRPLTRQETAMSNAADYPARRSSRLGSPALAAPRFHPLWIGVMVLGFIMWWPIGLAVLFYSLWSRSMCRHRGAVMPAGDEKVRSFAFAHDRRLPWLRRSLDRQPRLRRVSQRHAQAPRRRTARVQGFPLSPASRQGQGGVRPVHERAPQQSAGSAVAAKCDPTAETERSEGTLPPDVLKEKSPRHAAGFCSS